MIFYNQLHMYDRGVDLRAGKVYVYRPAQNGKVIVLQDIKTRP